MDKKLLDNKGRPGFGVINDAVDEVNYLDFDLRTSMDKQLPLWRKKMGFNQFQFIGAMNSRAIFGLAIVNLKLVSNMFVYLYRFDTRQLDEKSLVVPAALGTHMDQTPDRGQASFAFPGCHVSISAQEKGEVRKVVGHASPGVEFSLSLSAAPTFNPLRVCSKAGRNGWVYTQKAAGLDCGGVVNWAGNEMVFDPSDTRGSYDWSAGFMRRETSWNWACLSGMLPDGRMVGLNLASGVNETGVTENGLWVGNRFQKVNFSCFDFDSCQPDKDWHIYSPDKKVDLTFVPEGMRQEKLDVLVLASNFRQMFGKYYGYVVRGREKVIIDGIPGFAEDHFARW